MRLPKILVVLTCGALAGLHAISSGVNFTAKAGGGASAARPSPPFFSYESY